MTLFRCNHILMLFLKISFFIFLFFILFPSHNLCAHKITDENQLNIMVWERRFGGNDIENLNDFISVPNNIFITVGASGSYVNEDAWESIWIQKMNDNGEIISERIIGNSSYNSGNTIISAPDNNLVIGGEKNWLYCSACSETGEAWIAMIDNKLNIIWEKTFNLEGNSRILNMSSDGKRGFAMVGVSHLDRSGASKAWFAYADWGGNIVYSNTYNYLFQDKATGITNLGNNGFLICGYSQTSNLSESIAWILKTDKNGEVEWKQEFKTNIGINVLKKIIKLDKENFVAIGYTSAKGKGWQDGWVIKFNQDGELIWEKTYGTKNKDIFSSAVKQDNNIIIVGTTFVPVKNTTDGWIVKLNENGELLWDKTVGGENNESFNGISIKGKKTLYLFGSSAPVQINSLNQDVWIVKIDLS